VEAFQEWLAEGPPTSLEAVMERFKLLALNLSLYPGAPPEVLRLADRLATTAIRFVNAQSRVANDRSRAEVRAASAFAKASARQAGQQTNEEGTRVRSLGG